MTRLKLTEIFHSLQGEADSSVFVGIPSARERPLHCFDDTILDRRLEIGVHRQAEHLLGEAIADRNSALGDRKAPISRLAMTCFWICALPSPIW